MNKRQLRKIGHITLVAAATLWTPGLARAGTATTSFTVNANITNACTVSNTGNITLTQTLTTGATTVSVTCNLLTPWTITLAGSNDTAGQNALPYHYMKSSAGNYIEYVLTGQIGVGWTFADSQNRLANNSSFQATGTGLGVAQPAVITASATTGTSSSYSIATAASGTYTDTVTVTVTF